MSDHDDVRHDTPAMRARLSVQRVSHAAAALRAAHPAAATVAEREFREAVAVLTRELRDEGVLPERAIIAIKRAAAGHDPPPDASVSGRPDRLAELTLRHFLDAYYDSPRSAH